MNPVILFDGVCGLCNRFVRFILRRDRKDLFRFAPLQGDYAREILRRHGRDAAAMDTVMLVLDPGTAQERLVDKSRAAFAVLNELGGVWCLISWCRIVPRYLTDIGYAIMARTRYRIFGKYDTCPLPTAKDRGKFIGP